MTAASSCSNRRCSISGRRRYDRSRTVTCPPARRTLCHAVGDVPRVRPAATGLGRGGNAGGPKYPGPLAPPNGSKVSMRVRVAGGQALPARPRRQVEVLPREGSQGWPCCGSSRTARARVGALRMSSIWLSPKADRAYIRRAYVCQGVFREGEWLSHPFSESRIAPPCGYVTSPGESRFGKGYHCPRCNGALLVCWVRASYVDLVEEWIENRLALGRSIRVSLS